MFIGPCVDSTLCGTESMLRVHADDPHMICVKGISIFHINFCFNVMRQPFLKTNFVYFDILHLYFTHLLV